MNALLQRLAERISQEVEALEHIAHRVEEAWDRVMMVAEGRRRDVYGDACNF